MKRFGTAVGTAMLLTIGMGGAVSATTPTEPPAELVAADHPVVGTWDLIDVGPDSTPFTGAFFPDGVYIEASEGDISIGVWEAMGPDTVAMSYTATDEEGTFTVRAAITVDGDSLTAEYTLQIGGEGAPEGEYGPGSVTGTRVVVEPMGAPVGTLDELFASFPEEESVPPTTT